MPGLTIRGHRRLRMTEEIVFYLLPAVAGILIDVLVSLLMVVVEDDVAVVLYKRHPVLYLIIPMIALVLIGALVFSFRIYQNMAALQEERAEKIILENQITQMQGSMVEMEHLYDGVRSVKHDMKNHMAVLQNLIRKKYSGEDEEIRQYFEEMYQSVEQLDSRVHTGNAVSDVKLVQEGGKLIFSVRNPVAEKVEVIEGTGLLNVKGVADKYGGDFAISCDEEKFQAVVML